MEAIIIFSDIRHFCSYIRLIYQTKLLNLINIYVSLTLIINKKYFKREGFTSFDYIANYETGNDRMVVKVFFFNSKFASYKELQLF